MDQVRDDRVLATTKWVSICIVPVLVSAFVILYFFPGETPELWAWTIRSRMTAMFMGAGYLAGAWFFIRAATAKQGHRVNKGLLAITVFTALLELSTILHWGTFNHGHVSFWAWILLYTVTPVLLPLLWVMNSRTDPGGPAADDVLVPTTLRVAMTAGGILVLLFALAMFVRPSAFVGDWPWPLTPLTARVMSAFFAFPAVAWALFATDNRWSSFEIPMQTSIIGLALIIVATVRAWDEFKSTSEAQVYLGVLVVVLVWLSGVILAMRRRSSPADPGPPDSEVA
jgi:hypothetical protein